MGEGDREGMNGERKRITQVMYALLQVHGCYSVAPSVGSVTSGWQSSCILVPLHGVGEGEKETATPLA